MKKASTIFLIFAAVIFLLQLLVPATMIIGHEMTLDRGVEIKIRCQPIDPVDPFRGRYVRVRLDLPLPDKQPLPEEFYSQQQLFAILSVDDQGFAEISKIVINEPREDLYVCGQNSGWRETFDLGLDRYYMNERLAPEAEKLVRSGIRQESEVWASVKVWKGRAALSAIFVDGIPIEDLAGKQLDQSE